MDQIKQDELIHLKKTITLIDRLIGSNRSQISVEQEELKGLNVVSSDDYQNFKYHQGQVNFLNREIEIQETIRPVPYFARFDLADNLDEEDTYEKFYIGKTELVNDLNKIIYDWRSDIGYFYYQKNLLETKIGDAQKKVAIRRVLDIEDCELKAYKNEYMYGEIDVDSELVDPFLLEIIRTNRKNKRMTEIIRSIQSEQIEIINYGLNENIIIQGCAGSGKTMILTHRLSSLLYRHKEISEEDFLIITPNVFLNEQINGIAETLEIQRILRYTFFEFYQNLYSYFKTQIRDKSELRENLLFEDKFTNYIYSETFRNEMMFAVNAKHELFVDKKDLKKFFSLIESLNENVYSTPLVVENDFKQYLQAAENIIKTYNEVEKYIIELREIIILHKQDSSKLEVKIETDKKHLIATNQAVVDHTEALIADLQDSIQENQNSIREFNLKISALDYYLLKEQNNFNDVFNEFSELHVFLIKNINNKHIPSNYSNLLSIIKSDSKEIDRLNEQLLNSHGIFSYFKRLVLISKIENTTSQLKVRINSFIPVLKKLLQQEILSTINLEESQKKLLSSYRKITSKRFYFDDNPTFELFDDFIKENLRNINEVEDEISSLSLELRDKLGELESAIHNEKKFTKFLKLNDRSFIDSFERELRNIENNDINMFNQVIDYILTPKFSQYLGDFKTYLNRETIYARLLFCQEAYGRIHNPKYLLIDEGQNISLMEYKLIFGICEQETKFNIYGDINQSLSIERNITDWSSLIDLHTFTYLTLNRNYRNSVQITEYNNTQFNLEIMPIGISDEQVMFISLSNLLESLESTSNEINNSRIALIVKSKAQFKNNKVYNKLLSRFVISESANINNIMLFDLNGIKGMEFEIVYVIDENMGKNEKYLSYTRALNRLIIVRD